MSARGRRGIIEETKNFVWGVGTNSRRKIAINAKDAGILNRHVLCAVSGGADSVALLLLLIDLRDAGEIALTAAHFEHGIRGEDSARDRDFVRDLCAEKGVPCLLGAGDVPGEAKKAREGLESCARRLRRTFLETSRARTGADVIALAHHMDDQAETVLMHLLRGGGLGGASGMREREGDIVRPLLNFTKRQLTDFLEARGQAWREDGTNRISDTPRNILRNLALPEIARAYPGAARALSRFATIAADEDAHMNREAARLLQPRARGYAGVAILSLAPEIEPALLRRAIRLLLPGLEFEELERARAATGRVSLKSGAFAWRAGDTLYLAPPLSPPDPVTLPEEGECALFGVCRLSAAPAPAAPVTDGGLIQALRADAVSGAMLRTRAPGDFMRPLGMRGQKKRLSDILTDKKFPRPLRDRLPLVVKDGEVLWAAGVGVSENAKLEGNAAATRLEIRIDTEIGGETHA